MPSNEKSLADRIVSILSGANAKDGLKVKNLRKMVLLSVQQDESDKGAKKEFKNAVQGLEDEGIVQLNQDGQIFLKREKKKKDEKKKTKKKKRSAENTDESSPAKRAKHKGDTGDDDDNNNDDDDDAGQSSSKEDDIPSNQSSKEKNTPCKANPSGVTRLFLGNLPFAVDETGLKDFIPGMTHVKWITDKETGRFYGSAFVEMDTSASAAAAVAKAGQDLMGRSIKINFAPARPGDIWPPQKQVQTGGGQAGGKGIKALGEKPADCVKLFIGNLSYEIDDDGITKFFAAVDAEVKAVRWLHHRDSGDFKGWYVLSFGALSTSRFTCRCLKQFCFLPVANSGYVEFWNTEVGRRVRAADNTFTPSSI